MSWSLTWALIGLVLLAQVVLAWPLARLLRQRGSSPGLLLALTGTLLGLGALLYGLFGWLDLDLEQHGLVLWTYSCSAALLVGLGASLTTRRMPMMELGLAIGIVLELAAVLAVVQSDDGGLAAPPWRALLVAPAALGLCGYFGASLGYLLWGAGKLDVGLGYESLIGRRFLLSKSSPVLSTVTTISVIGVSLGVWLVLVSLGVLAGFESDLRRKIIGANAHVVVQARDTEPFALAPTMLQTAKGVQGVLAVAPYAEGEVAVASSSNYSGALLFGIDPRASPEVLTVLQELQHGSLGPLTDEMRPVAAAVRPDDDEAEFQAPSPLPGIVIGVEMAKSLNVKVGDQVRVISPLLEVLTPVGVAPKSLGFRVAAIFSSKMYEYDARFAYVSLPAARRFFELEDGAVSGLQLRVADPDGSDRVGKTVAARLGDDFAALDWKQRNQTLFAALKLERVVAFVVLVFIILVASFSIVNTLTMSVIEKRKEIAILKTMGARDVGVMKVFLVQGLLVGAFGTLIGAAMAVGTVGLLERFGFWIPGEVYYIDSLPVRLETLDVVLVVLAALLIVWDFAVFPALRGSRLEPVEGLRDG